MVKIALFCGGRGSSSIIQEILKIPDLQLHLLINAYDNGGSTGELRRYIPGYLGPSDFRKNLSYLLRLHDPQQYTLSQLLDYRLPDDFNEKAVPAMFFYLQDPCHDGQIPPKLVQYLDSIHGDLSERLNEYLMAFFNYYQEHQEGHFNFKNCSFGNFFFAGAFLKNNQDFSQAIRELMKVFQSKTNATLVNVTRGENRYLIGLKEDGELLDNEIKIVSQQTPIKFTDIYLIPEPLTLKEIDDFQKLSINERKIFLESKQKPVYLSEDAEKFLLDSDIIIYGPGTQFSSLFPSYKTQGLPEAVISSRAKLKIFVMNLAKDHDISSYMAEDLLDCALRYLGDPQNKNNIITHVLYDDSTGKKEAIQFKNPIASGSEYKNIKIIKGNYTHPVFPSIHNGIITFETILETYDKLNKQASARMK